MGTNPRERGRGQGGDTTAAVHMDSHQGNGRCSYTGLRIEGRIRKRERKRRRQIEKDETMIKVLKAG